MHRLNVIAVAVLVTFVFLPDARFGRQSSP